VNNWRQMDLEELIALSGDTPASHSVSPGSDEARKMTVTSGQKLKGSWLPSGPLGDCLRMLLDTSAWASTKCFLTWKAKATPRGRQLFQLVPSMPRTDETEFGLWPTPSATDGKGSGVNGDLRDRLDYAVERGATKTKKFWPTPRAGSDAMCGGSGHAKMLKGTDLEINRGSLNPQWVEWLMGFPEGWTDLKPSETLSSRKSPK